MTFHISLFGRKNLTIEIYRQIRDAILNGLLSSGARRAIEASVAIQILSRFAVNPIERMGIVLDTAQSRRIKLKKDCGGFGDAFEIDYSGSPHNWPANSAGIGPVSVALGLDHGRKCRTICLT